MNINLESKVIVKRVPCEKCRAKGRDSKGDNLVVYSDGGTWCYVCNRGVVNPDEHKKIKLEVYETKEENLMEFGTKEWNKLKVKCSKNKDVDTDLPEAPHKAFNFRGISDETYKLFGVLNEVLPHDEGETPQVYKQHYPILKEIEGVPQISGVKTREVSTKRFSVKGENKQATSLLFGQFLAQKSSKKTVVITSGECFPEEVEVMTNRGFISFKDFKEEDEVLCVDPSDHRSFFAPAKAIIKKNYEGELIDILDESSSYSVICTPDHNLAFMSRGFGKQLIKVKAKDSVNKPRFLKASIHNAQALPYTSINLTQNEVKLCAVLCYDLYKSKSYKNGVLSIVTPSSTHINLIKRLCEDIGISYAPRYFVDAYGVNQIEIKVHLPYVYEEIINNNYRLPLEWLINMSYKQRLIIINTLMDLSLFRKYKHIIKVPKDFLASSENKDFFDYLFYLTGKSYVVSRKTDEYDTINVGAVVGTTKDLESRKKTIPFKGKVYCVESVTGFIMIRHRGFISICGNCDAMASYEMLQGLGHECPVFVSSTVGEGGIGQYKAQYEFFNKFEKIIIIPDQDTAGKEALKKAVQALPRGKVYVVDLPLKDPNDMLMKGFQNEFILRYRNAKPFVPEGVVGSRELYEKIIEASHIINIPIPDFMIGLKELFPVGFALESIMNLVAASGIGGKSLLNKG